ncbi:unnamed protein product, partial [Mesorhabditis belari]|uniref:Uncharacterized protein n=1 Tax=Mesorhabditis belari TaxID=2138241 RepID=A0AAF3F050_9BILA
MPFAEHNDSPIYCHHGSPHIFEPENISVSPLSEDPSEFNPEIQDASAPQWTEDFRNDEEMVEDNQYDGRYTMEDNQYDEEHPCEQSQFSGNFRWDRPLTDKCLEGISLPDWTQTMFKRRIGADRPSTSEIEQTREIITAKRRRNSPEYHQTSYGNVKRVEADSSVLDSELEMSNAIEKTPESSRFSPNLPQYTQSSQIDYRSPFFSR